MFYSNLGPLIGRVDRKFHNYFKIKVPPTEEELLSDAIDAGLAEHNKFRALHQDTPSMKLSQKLIADAQACAEKILNEWTANPSLPLHRYAQDPALNRKHQRENRFFSMAESPAEAVVEATNHWYNTKKDYDWADERNVNLSQAFQKVKEKK